MSPRTGVRPMAKPRDKLRSRIHLTFLVPGPLETRQAGTTTSTRLAPVPAKSPSLKSGQYNQISYEVDVELTQERVR